MALNIRASSLAFTLYLTHKQMLHLAKVSTADYMERPLQTVVTATALMAAAALTLHFAVERPFLKLRDRLLSATRAQRLAEAPAKSDEVAMSG